MLTASVESLLRKARPKGVLLDANLVVLLVVGETNRKFIPHFRAAANQGFTEADFDLLQQLLVRARLLLTTPGILAEVSNHLDKQHDAARQPVLETFQHLVRTAWDERHVPGKELVQRPGFLRYGLTDMSMDQLAESGVLVITVDGGLDSHLRKSGKAVINLNHLRFPG